MPQKYLSVGSDPEVFLQDRYGNLVSAIGILPGSKEMPFKTLNGSIQPDNISAEFNSIPSTTRDQFIANHLAIMSDLTRHVEPFDLSLNISASVMANKEILKDPAARKAGCMPDMNAWNRSVNPPPILRGGLRAAGGHLHIAFDQAEDQFGNHRIDFIKGCDMILGIPSILLDTDKRRRTLYGKAGAHRPKYRSDFDPYDGVEYRVLSNFWLNTTELMGWAFDSVKTVYDNLEEISVITALHRERIVDIINNADKRAASLFMKEFGEYYE